MSKKAYTKKIKVSPATFPKEKTKQDLKDLPKITITQNFIDNKCISNPKDALKESENVERLRDLKLPFKEFVLQLPTDHTITGYNYYEMIYINVLEDYIESHIYMVDLENNRNWWELAAAVKNPFNDKKCLTRAGKILESEGEAGLLEETTKILSIILSIKKSLQDRRTIYRKAKNKKKSSRAAASKNIESKRKVIALNKDKVIYYTIEAKDLKVESFRSYVSHVYSYERSGYTRTLKSGKVVEVRPTTCYHKNYEDKGDNFILN